MKPRGIACSMASWTAALRLATAASTELVSYTQDQSIIIIIIIIIIDLLGLMTLILYSESNFTLFMAIY
jgi:hypothetical protein